MPFLLSKRSWAVLSRVLLSLIIVYTLASIFASVMHMGVDWAFKGANNGMFFGDLRGLTSALECRGDANDIYLVDNCVSERLPKFNYTLLSLNALKFIRFKYAYTEYLGAALGISSILVTCIFFARALGKNSIWAACATLALASFPLQLAIERGNSDQLLYAGLALYAWTTTTAPDSLIRKASLAVLSFSLVALKIFPVLTILPHGLLLRSRQIFLFAVVPSLIALFIQMPIIGSISANTPKGSGPYSYGLLTHYAFAIKKLAPANVDIRIGVAILILLKLIIVAATFRHWLSRKTQLRSGLDQLLLPTLKHQASYNFFLVGALTFVATYFVFINWDYRLISLFFCVPLLIILNSGKSKAPEIKSFTVACLGGIFMLSYEGYLGLLAPGLPDLAASMLSDLLVQPLLVGSILSLMTVSGITKTAPRYLTPNL
jgi:hypothetical protein